MKLYLILAIICTNLWASQTKQVSKRLVGVDIDQLECELILSVDNKRKDLVKITINNQEDFFIPKDKLNNDFQLIADNKITRLSSKISGLNGPRELKITAKPNGSIDYKIIEHDKIHYEDHEYKCSQLKLTEK